MTVIIMVDDDGGRIITGVNVKKLEEDDYEGEIEIGRDITERREWEKK